jgi:26S proteasome regulatory subunit T5
MTMKGIADIACRFSWPLFAMIGLEEEEKEAGDAVDADAQRKTRSAVVRTSTRQTIFLPIPGLVETDKLKPSDLVGTNKDSYLILEKLPDEFDSRVQAMEVDEKPTEEYSDIGGADQQIQELIEAVVLPMTHKDMFDSIGIRPPKGVLLHGPPGTCPGWLASMVHVARCKSDRSCTCR